MRRWIWPKRSRGCQGVRFYKCNQKSPGDAEVRQYCTSSVTGLHSNMSRCLFLEATRRCFLPKFFCSLRSRCMMFKILDSFFDLEQSAFMGDHIRLVVLLHLRRLRNIIAVIVAITWPVQHTGIGPSKISMYTQIGCNVHFSIYFVGWIVSLRILHTFVCLNMCTCSWCHLQMLYLCILYKKIKCHITHFHLVFLTVRYTTRSAGSTNQTKDVALE